MMLVQLHILLLDVKFPIYCYCNTHSLFLEQNRDLKMEPAELRWSAAGGMQKISLLNQSNERQAVKVKFSDNNFYRVNHVYAIVEPGQTLSVDVMRQNGSNKDDKIVFVTTRVSFNDYCN